MSDQPYTDAAVEAAMKAALAQQKAAHPNEPLLFPDEDGYDLLNAALTAAYACPGGTVERLTRELDDAIHHAQMVERVRDEAVMTLDHWGQRAVDAEATLARADRLAIEARMLADVAETDYGMTPTSLRAALAAYRHTEEAAE